MDPKKIMLFIVDVTNAHDKECLVDVTKVPISGKTIFTELELETVQTQHGYPRYGKIPIQCTYIMLRLLRIFINELKQLHKQHIAL